MGWLKRHEGAGLALAGLVVAAILFVAVNVFADNTFRGAHVDLTENGQFTLSAGTRHALGSLKEPIDLSLYYSPTVGEAAPRYAAYYDRVRELLHQYVALSNGKLRLHLINPEPFSEAEDRAVAEGLQGVPVTSAGETGYFGLVGVNSVDGRRTIPFFNIQRESFLEYDLTKLVYALAHPDLPVLGVISGIPLGPQAGGYAAGESRPTLFDDLSEFFQVEDLEPKLSAISDRIDVLFVIDPSHLPADAVRAIGQFVDNGGRALIMVDPLTESAAGVPANPASEDDVETLLKTFGITMLRDKVAGDLDAARRVNAGPRPGNAGDYVAWLALGKSAFDASDPVLANMERINLATAGVLEALPKATTKVVPLIETGPRSMAIDVARVREIPDIQGLLRDFRPQGKPIMLAARISGDAPPAFPDAGAASAAKPKPIHVIVVADADMIFDRFWLTSTDFFGQRVEIPVANNADFIMNALENLSGSDALAGLRGRGSSYHPFTLIESLRRNAEMVYRAKEQQLQDELKALQQKLLQAEGGPGETSGGTTELRLSAEQRAAIEQFRGEILAVRRQLREVQRALRSDIESVEGWVKVLNIGAVPVLLTLVAIIVTIVKRSRRSRRRLVSAEGGPSR